MAHAPAASDTERLPWLKDEHVPPAPGAPRSLLAWAAAAALVIGGGSFWYGMTGPGPADEPAPRVAAAPEAVMPVSEPRPSAPAPSQVRPAPTPQVEPVAPPPPVRVAESRQVRSSEEVRPKRTARKSPSRTRAIAERRSSSRAASRSSAVAARTHPASPRYWPSRRSAGAAGRMVRVGTFDSSRQAKRGWVHLARAYPGIQGIPAVVVRNRSERNGRTYYRLQMGTTSQAHSAVLCQRMRMIGQSCIIVGSPRRQGARA